jgi:hypothetical protein
MGIPFCLVAQADNIRPVNGWIDRKIPKWIDRWTSVTLKISRKIVERIMRIGTQIYRSLNMWPKT